MGSANLREQRIGIEIRQKDGSVGKCVGYIDHRDCDIELRKGDVKKTVRHTRWYLFSQGKLSVTSANHSRRSGHIGEKKEIAGELWEIVSSDRNKGHSYYIVKNCLTGELASRKYDSFRKGNIIKERFCENQSEPGLAASKHYHDEHVGTSRVGIRYVQKYGMEAECIAYRNTADGDFRFDDGTVKEHRAWFEFEHGMLSPLVKGDFFRTDGDGEPRVGRRIMQKCGEEAECIAYRNSDDGDYELSGGKIYYHTRWDLFKKGRLSNKISREKTIGRKVWQRNIGLTECVSYTDKLDADFKAENGQEFTHRNWSDFLQGILDTGVDRTPLNKKKDVDSLRTDVIAIQKNGLYAKCTAYRNGHDADILFEDGTEIKGYKNWLAFYGGTVKHPTLDSAVYGRKGSFLDYDTIYAYDVNGTAYYQTEDRKTGRRSVMTAHEMMASRGITPVFPVSGNDSAGRKE